MVNTQDSLFGKTSQEHCLPTEALTSGLSSTKWLRQGHWNLSGQSWMLNSSESPSAEEESSCLLSSVLQTPQEVEAKFFLSPRACQGILRRAARRGKVLPPQLQEALQQVAMKGEQPPSSPE